MQTSFLVTHARADKQKTMLPASNSGTGIELLFTSHYPDRSSITTEHQFAISSVSAE